MFPSSHCFCCNLLDEVSVIHKWNQTLKFSSPNKASIPASLPRVTHQTSIIPYCLQCLICEFLLLKVSSNLKAEICSSKWASSAEASSLLYSTHWGKSSQLFSSLSWTFVCLHFHCNFAAMQPWTQDCISVMYLQPKKTSNGNIFGRFVQAELWGWCEFNGEEPTVYVKYGA